MVEAFGIPTFGLERFEADDLLGTLARQASERGDIDTVIVTGDTDTLQLVGPRVGVLMFVPQAGSGGMVHYDEAAGTASATSSTRINSSTSRPSKAIKSDNIPGVAGIGEKTADQVA